MIDDPQTRETHQPRPITVRVHEACRLTGIGRSKLYELIAAGEIEIIKVGTITLVPIASLMRFLERRWANPQQAS
jgi:excisionase family DNA binding protein